MPVGDPATIIDKLQKEVASLREQIEESRHLASIPTLNPLSIFEFDLQGEVVYLNPAAEKTLAVLGLSNAKPFLPDGYPGVLTDAQEKVILQSSCEKNIQNYIFEEIIVYSAEYKTVRIFAKDITQQRQAEEALKQSKQEIIQTQEFLEAATRGTGVLIATVDKDYRYTYFNQKYKDEVQLLSGREIKIGMNMLDVFSHLPELQKVVREEWSQVLRGESTNKVLPFGDPALHRKTYNILHTPIWDDQHRVVGAGEVGYDFTEQLRIQTALQESEVRYYSLFEGMTEGFAIHEMVFDENGVPCDYRILDINPAFERLTGLNREAVIGKMYRTLLPEEGDRWIKRFGKVVTTGEPAQFEEFSPTLNKHYEVFAYRCGANQFAVLFLDITERKKLEDNLRVNLMKYTVLFDSLPLGVTVSDKGGYILESNREAIYLLGLPEEEQKNRTINGPEWKVIRPDRTPMPAEEYPSVRAIQEQRRIEDVEMGIVKDDDQVTWISVTAAPLPLNDFGVVITYTDITRRIQIEEELRQAQERLEFTVQQRTQELQDANAALESKIEERRRIEAQLIDQTKALDAERKRFNDVLEILPAYTILLTPDYHVAFSNRYFRERFGDDQGRRCYDYLFGLEAPCDNCETFKVLQSKKRHHWEWLGPDNRNYDVFDYPFEDVDGSTLILELGIDITERKQAEDAFRKLNAYNRSLIEANLDALVTITPDGKIGDVNSVTEAITGYNRSELIGKDFHSYFTDPEKARAGYQQVFKTGFVRDYELVIQHKDGHITPVTYNASVYRDETGNVAGVFAAARDITRQKHSEQALQKSEQQYRSLVIATSQIVWGTNAEGDVVEDIPMWREYTGQSFEECKGQGWINALHPIDQEHVAEIWRGAVKSKSFYETECRIRNRSNSYGNFALKGVPIVDDNGDILSWISTGTDITEKKNYESQLIQAEKHAVIGRMVGSVTHEINNPLQTIKNCLYLIQQDLVPDSLSKEPLEIAISETQRLSNIVGQLRQLYRPQVSQAKRIYPLKGIISEVQSLLSHQLASAHVDWKSASGIQDYPISCIREQVIEVFLNICMNAIEAMQPSGGVLTIGTVYSSEKGQVGVLIGDRGPGIKPDILPHIFEPFTTTKEYGLGLGLSICYEIVQKHGGQITVDSQLGKGTNFTIWLPVNS